MNRAIAAARGEQTEAERRPEIAIHVPAYLPAEAIADPGLRVNRRLDRIQTDLAARMISRMSFRTASATSVRPCTTCSAWLRLACRHLGIARVSAGPQAVALDRSDGSRQVLEISEPRPDVRLQRLATARVDRLPGPGPCISAKGGHSAECRRLLSWTTLGSTTGHIESAGCYGKCHPALY